MYVGRFAPTTSGPLHLGSLLAAVASYLDAKAHDGKWLLRLDDIDVPHSSELAADMAKTTLENHGLFWDNPIARQSDHIEHYEDALLRLSDRDLLFYCTCTRSMLRGKSTYPGTCRGRKIPPTEPSSIRVRVSEEECGFNDRIQGRVKGKLGETEGDFIVMRKDGIAAFPLAVIVDDAAMGITDVVRGADLCEHTLTQIYLLDELGISTPNYAHIPVLNQRDEIKLSKRDKAIAIDNRFPTQNLHWCLHMLGLKPPDDVFEDELLLWGIEHWDIDRVPKHPAVADFMSI